MKKIIVMLSALILAFCLVGCNSGNTEGGTTATPAPKTDYEALKAKGKMIVGTTIYEPMNYKDDAGNWEGFDVEFAQAVGKKLGLDVEFFVIDWNNKFFELESGAIDCIWNGMTITDEVKKNTSVSKPYVENAQVVVMAADKVDAYATAESMKDLKFAAEAGSAGEKLIKENGFENYTAVTAQSDALLEVASGSADACVIDITMANSMTGEGTSYANLKPGIALSSEEYGIGFRKGSDMTEKVNAIIDEMMADGSLQALAEKYSLTLVK